MTSYRTALLATAATALSLAATPAALANGLTFTNYTTASGLGDDLVRGVYASGSNIYAATDGGLSIASEPEPVPGPLPVVGAEYQHNRGALHHLQPAVPVDLPPADGAPAP